MVHINSPITFNCPAKKSWGKKAFSTVATLVRIHLVSMLDVYELLKNTGRSWASVKTDAALHSLFPK